ncbi:hypothetical protein PIB30_009435 [Stylosanthes scabra]|uniref:Uncharacterized protein n=1 Tax=Stylosanthes scabra TaxID=79078 RepID=A0ABU6X4N7_9FABA|nr:hypothetical protein [Stylosanthes scabra]
MSFVASLNCGLVSASQGRREEPREEATNKSSNLLLWGGTKVCSQELTRFSGPHVCCTNPVDAVDCTILGVTLPWKPILPPHELVGFPVLVSMASLMALASAARAECADMVAVGPISRSPLEFLNTAATLPYHVLGVKLASTLHLIQLRGGACQLPNVDTV